MLNKSTYYYQCSVKKEDNRKRSLDPVLVEQLDEISGYELTYGYRKITQSLGTYNHKKIYRHMKRLNRLQPRKLKKKRVTRLELSCPTDSNVRSRC